MTMTTFDQLVPAGQTIPATAAGAVAPTLTPPSNPNQPPPLLLPFTKMHGLGNDFVVLDATQRKLEFTPARLRWLADRHWGVGCDQVLIVEPAQSPSNDFRYRIFNADGTEVENCGNGARCFVQFVHERGLSTRPQLRVETLAGVLTLQRQSDGRIRVDMGLPRFDPAQLPFLPAAARPPSQSMLAAGALSGHWRLPLPFSATERAPLYELQVNGHPMVVSLVSMGNPHAVQVVADLDSSSVDFDGAAIEAHNAFPRRVNAGFMLVLDRNHIRLRVYERGVGETLACGSGACAAAVAGICRGLLTSPVEVQTRGGRLTLEWNGPGEAVFMTGPAQTVFSGQLSWPPQLDPQPA